jgi:hypothetical protein
LAAVHRAIRDGGGTMPTTVRMDELLDELLAQPSTCDAGICAWISWPRAISPRRLRLGAVPLDGWLDECEDRDDDQPHDGSGDHERSGFS